jgi:hypothetical protein
MGARSLSQFAKCCGLPVDRMAVILEGAEPTRSEYPGIANCIMPKVEQNTLKLMKAYGYRFDDELAAVKDVRDSKSKRSGTVPRQKG